MATVGGEPSKIEEEKEKPATKVAFEAVGGCSQAKIKHVVVGREHARWSELSALAWSTKR